MICEISQQKIYSNERNKPGGNDISNNFDVSHTTLTERLTACFSRGGSVIVASRKVKCGKGCVISLNYSVGSIITMYCSQCGMVIVKHMCKCNLVRFVLYCTVSKYVK